MFGFVWFCTVLRRTVRDRVRDTIEEAVADHAGRKARQEAFPLRAQQQ